MNSFPFFCFGHETFSHLFRPQLIVESDSNFRIFAYISRNDQIILFRREKMTLGLFIRLVAEADPRDLTDSYREWVARPLNRMYESFESQKTAKIIDSLSRMFDFPMMAALNINDSRKLAQEIDSHIRVV